METLAFLFVCWVIWRNLPRAPRPHPLQGVPPPPTAEERRHDDILRNMEERARRDAADPVVQRRKRVERRRDMLVNAARIEGPHVVWRHEDLSWPPAPPALDPAECTDAIALAATTLNFDPATMQRIADLAITRARLTDHNPHRTAHVGSAMTHTDIDNARQS